jgi:hypothetical protein
MGLCETTVCRKKGGCGTPEQHQKQRAERVVMAQVNTAAVGYEFVELGAIGKHLVKSSSGNIHAIRLQLRPAALAE